MAPGEVAHKVGEEGEKNIYVPNKHLPFTQTDQRQRAGWAEERLQTDKLARSEDY